MEKIVRAVSDDGIQVVFTEGATARDVQQLLKSCEKGTCGCDIDPVSEFQSVEFTGSEPRILFTVKPEARGDLMRKMESCTCEPAGNESTERVACC